jgi:murein DD-endopeptidase MepM/ murein hydrolase activator NlpD
MISPYLGDYKVTQPFGVNGHRGIDLSASFGIGDTTIICVQSGQCVYAGWENPRNQYQGYGLCVVIKDNQNRHWIYAHLSKFLIGTGDIIKQGQAIAIEGTTGSSTGLHLHLECRQGGWAQSNISLNVAEILGIPNRTGLVNNQSQAVSQVSANNTTAAAQTNTYNFKYIYSDKIKELQQILNQKGFTLVEDGLFGINTLNALRKYTIEINDSGSLTRWTQEYLASKGYNVGYIDGLAGPQTMFGIEQFQRDKNLGTTKRNNYTYLGGDDWYVLIEG